MVTSPRTITSSAVPSSVAVMSYVVKVSAASVHLSLIHISVADNGADFDERIHDRRFHAQLRADGGQRYNAAEQIFNDEAVLQIHGTLEAPVGCVVLKQVVKIRLLQTVGFLQGGNQGGHFQSQCPAHGQPLTVAGADQTGNAGGDAVYVVVLSLIHILLNREKWKITVMGFTWPRQKAIMV